MSTVDPIRDVAERLGRTMNQFEPGTPLYTTVVERGRSLVRTAHTRNDITEVMHFLEKNLLSHLADGPRQEFARCVSTIDNMTAPLPVDAFKEGFARGTGEGSPEPGERPSA